MIAVIMDVAGASKSTVGQLLARALGCRFLEAEGQCAHCGAKNHFAEAHLYTQAPGFVARCPV